MATVPPGAENAFRAPMSESCVDQQMPGMSGVDFLQRVSRVPDTVRVMLAEYRIQYGF